MIVVWFVEVQKRSIKVDESDFVADKERLKNPKRVFTKQMARLKFEMKTKILKKLKLPKKKKSIFWDRQAMEERRKETKKFWYFTSRWRKKKEGWKNVLQINKNWKIYFLPILLEEFEKPRFFDEKYKQKLKKYKRNLEIFDFCRNFKFLEDFKK